jgi:hypothetical protein
LSRRPLSATRKGGENPTRAAGALPVAALSAPKKGKSNPTAVVRLRLSPISPRQRWGESNQFQSTPGR